jgi:hypothetical protein
MADELSAEVALELARSLKTVKGFPWDADTAKATAEDLMRWCKGAIVNNLVWPAEAQARWLITQARENWDEWKGTPELKRLFSGKFAPVVVVPGNAVTDYSVMPCICGSEKKFKDCCQGKPLDMGPLEKLRRSPSGKVQ